MKKVIIVTLSVLSLFFIKVNAQDNEFSQMKEIKKQLGPNEVLEIERAEKLLKEGDDIMESAEQKSNTVENLRKQSNSESKRKGKKMVKEANKLDESVSKQKIDASIKYGQANKIVYNIYKKNLEDLGKKTTDDKRKAVLESISEAETFFKQAMNRRQRAVKIKEVTDAKKYYLEANQLESDAIALQIQAYGTYLGWYDKEEETTKVTPPVKDTVVANTKVDENVNRTFNSLQETIIYKVQIAASDVPLSIEKLRKIYPSNEIINNEKEGNLYKYSVGYYRSYEEAYAAKMKMNVAGAFIVAYKNGQRVKDITEVASPTVHPGKNGTANVKNMAGVEFRVQLTATPEKLTANQIATYNKTKLPVTENKSGKWYKYTIGNFSTKEQAEAFRKANGYDNTNSFIVIYKNGQELL